ncbi:MAG: hypothetical protein ACM3P0_10100 [Acidobacteriota bacterium]
MKSVLSQILIVFLGVFVLVFVLFKAGTVSPEFLNASYYGGAINLINILAALYAFNYSVDKGNKTFLLLNMGGMLVRMFLILGSVIIFLKFLNIDKYGFIFTFSILYISLLIVEVNYFRVKITQLKISQKKA